MLKVFTYLALSLLYFSDDVSADVLQDIRSASRNKSCIVEYELGREPAIALAASGYDKPSINQKELLGLIEEFIAAGCPIDAEGSGGMSPINLAVLRVEPELLKVLLRHGANPLLKVSKSKSWINGKGSLEFSKLVYEMRGGERREEIVRIIGAHIASQQPIGDNFA